MRSKECHELWKIRFQKIYDTEIEAFNFYKDLLEKHDSILSRTRAKSLLQKIMNDEKKHARVARKLLKLVSIKKRAKQKHINKIPAIFAVFNLLDLLYLYT